MQRLEVSCAVRHIYIYIYMSLGTKGLIFYDESHGHKTSNFYYKFTLFLKYSKIECVPVV